MRSSEVDVTFDVREIRRKGLNWLKLGLSGGLL
jgi:hypothetical protein